VIRRTGEQETEGGKNVPVEKALGKVEILR
jgi:hypothetical protein